MTNNLLKRFCAFALLSFTFANPVFAQTGRGPATVEEGERVVKLAAFADKDPLTVMNSVEGRWFQKWADDVPDYQFGPDKGVFWFHNGVAKADLMRVLRFHHTVTTAAFQLQNKIKDPRENEAGNEAKTLAGVEGVLRAYEALVAKNAENRVQAIDDLIVARNKGGLADLVKKMPAMPSR
jgi:carboxypeptidase Q